MKCLICGKQNSSIKCETCGFDLRDPVFRTAFLLDDRAISILQRKYQDAINSLGWEENASQRLTATIDRTLDLLEKEKKQKLPFYTQYGRMLNVLDFFSGETDPDSQNKLEQMDYRFYRNLLEEYYQDLPIRNGKITFFPLYSVMQGNNLKHRLNGVIRDYYQEPLQGERFRKVLLSKIKRNFLHVFFENNGSLQELRGLVKTDDLREIIQSHRNEYHFEVQVEELPDQKFIKHFLSPEYQSAREQVCQLLDIFYEEQPDLLVEALNDEELLNSICTVENWLSLIRDCILVRMKRFEGEKPDAGENENPSLQYSDQLNREFDLLICDMLVNEETKLEELVRICYDAVRNAGITTWE